MLSKSKGSAIIMALVASLPRIAVGLALAAVTCPSFNKIGGSFQLDAVEGIIGNLALLVTLVGFLLLLVIGVRAFVIYTLTAASITWIHPQKGEPVLILDDTNLG